MCDLDKLHLFIYSFNMDSLIKYGFAHLQNNLFKYAIVFKKVKGIQNIFQEFKVIISSYARKTPADQYLE